VDEALGFQEKPLFLLKPGFRSPVFLIFPGRLANICGGVFIVSLLNCGQVEALEFLSWLDASAAPGIQPAFVCLSVTNSLG
jgi:hypothetical protein